MASSPGAANVPLGEIAEVLVHLLLATVFERLIEPDQHTDDGDDRPEACRAGDEGRVPGELREPEGGAPAAFANAR
jgi:hypothetical protein